MTEPLLRRLKNRGDTITVAALPWVAPVYRVMPQVSGIIELPFAHGRLQWTARRTIAKGMRGLFDTAYVCPNSFKSALLPWMAGIPERIGYHGEARYGVLNRRLPNPRAIERPPMVAFYSALCGESEASEERPALVIAPRQVTSALTSMRLAPQTFYAFAPGAEYGPAKRWPARHFAALAGQLDAPVILLGSSKDNEVCADIAGAVNAVSPGQCVDWSGKTTLDHAIAAISAAKAMVSNDSGLMHVAAAFGVPQVALFGSSSPLHTPPLNPSAHVIWLRNDPQYTPVLSCSPCFQRVCPLGHTRCLVDITPGTVLRFL